MKVHETQTQVPILQRQIHGKKLVYLDNAATTQKPESVITAISDYYRTHNANVHRGVHTLSDESTERYEQARQKIAAFFGARADQLISTRNSTEAMNLLVQMWEKFLRPGDVIVVTMQEHHSTLVPWQMVSQRTGCEFIVLPMDDQSTWPINAFAELLQEKKRSFAGGRHGGGV
ncbi:aminotransferase class V-fold PLP-dependent enzyme [Candidatus Woesebacteria bacterium]|nr:aminotransferase class V-fold PLP-dependent enzyme [Candidatus Woesebacteria bacterium]